MLATQSMSFGCRTQTGTAARAGLGRTTPFAGSPATGLRVSAFIWFVSAIAKS
jgi:hypothetical protein